MMSRTVTFVRHFLQVTAPEKCLTAVSFAIALIPYCPNAKAIKRKVGGPTARPSNWLYLIPYNSSSRAPGKLGPALPALQARLRRITQMGEGNQF